MMATVLEVVAQFEPDFDGTWETEVALPVGSEAAEDPQWVVWPDAALEAAWAAAELAAEWRAAARLAHPR